MTGKNTLRSHVGVGLVCAMFFTVMVIPDVLFAQDWPQWRGVAINGHASSGATAPVQWNNDSGLLWKTAIPGRGNSSPTIVGDRIYLTTGDERNETQSLLILDRIDGKLLKKIETHVGNLPDNISGKNSHANSTVASDGEQVFVMFLNDAAPILTAYDLDGNQAWQKRVCGETRVNFEWGFGSSPIVVDDLVIVATEFNIQGSGIYAFDKRTGKPVWHTPRSQQFSYSTPAVATLQGKKVLLLSGNYSFAAYDVQTGHQLWSQEGTTMATCGTMVWDGYLNLGFASGGHPDKFTAAVKLDGSHEVVWSHPVKCYEQSLLSFEGHVLAVSDGGVAHLWQGKDGEKKWHKRLKGNFSSSPLLVDGKIYVTSESGETFVFEANTNQYVELSRNKLGDQAFATPTPSDGKLYHRYIEGKQEYLVAIGK
ncbi:MAG: PQQ-binding-like beta-propeller repeat protein [Planctomycetota bacterium]